MEWNDETIGRLRALWSEGHSTAEIGRRMGVSKNAVVGKAHRLHLSSRPSPILREPGGTPRRRAPRRIVGPTLPALAAASQPLPVEFVPAAPIERLTPVLRAVPTARPGPGGRVLPCCWPLGEPGTRSFRFCDAFSEPGKPYCETHASVAYVRVKERRDDVA